MGALEETVIRTLSSFNIEAGRVPGRIGVWVDGAKVCAMGVKVSRWVTMHGLALNVMSPFPAFLLAPPTTLYVWTRGLVARTQLRLYRWRRSFLVSGESRPLTF